MGKKPLTMAVFAAIAILVFAACSPQVSPTPAASTGTTPTAEASTGAGTPTEGPPAELALPEVPTGYTELDAALGADKPFNGTKVSIQTQWIGGEGEGFAAAIADFAAATGIAVQIDSIGSSHETVLKTRIEGGSPPDMAVLAQPTGVLAYANDGKLIDVATFMDAAKLNAEFPSTIGLISEGGHIWGIPTKADVKSMIWYPIKAFAAKGYTVPDDVGRARRPRRQDRRRRQPPVLRQRRRPRRRDGLAAHGLGRGGPPQDRGSAGHERLDQPQDHVHRPQDQGRLRQGRLAPVQGRLRRRRWHRDREQRPMTEVMDPMFNEDTAAPGCWMQKIPVWYGPDFFPDKRANGGDSKYVIGEDIGIFPFPTIYRRVQGRRGLG